MAMRPRGVRAMQTLLDEERLVDVLDRLGLLTDRDGQRRQPDRTAAELLAQGAEDRPVDLVQTTVVDAEHGQALARRRGVDRAVTAHLGEVADPAQQAVGDARRATRPAGDLPGPVGVDLHVEDAGRPGHDRLELGRVVVVEPGDEAEAVAQRAGDHPGAGRGADEGERRQGQADARRRRTLARRRCRAGSPPSPGRGSPRRRATAGGSRR